MMILQCMHPYNKTICCGMYTKWIVMCRKTIAFTNFYTKEQSLNILNVYIHIFQNLGDVSWYSNRTNIPSLYVELWIFNQLWCFKLHSLDKDGSNVKSWDMFPHSWDKHDTGAQDTAGGLCSLIGSITKADDVLWLFLQYFWSYHSVKNTLWN